MSESPIFKRIMLEESRKGNRVFRNNVGQGWQGKKSWKNGSLTLHDPRPINFGLCEGSADLIGWRTIEITQEMVGKKAALFYAAEIKRKKTATSKDQTAFLKAVEMAGGIAEIIRE
jgi:hypothetical protein